VVYSATTHKKCEHLLGRRTCGEKKKHLYSVNRRTVTIIIFQLH